MTLLRFLLLANGIGLRCSTILVGVALGLGDFWSTCCFLLFCSNFVLARDRCLLLELEEAFVEPDNEDSGAEVGNVAEDVTGAAAVAAGVFSLVVVVIFVVAG